MKASEHALMQAKKAYERGNIVAFEAWMKKYHEHLKNGK